MSYGKVKESFWTDDKIMSLSDDAKMLALYFMTGPHRNMLGCMRVPNGYLMEDLGWASERLADAITMLCEKAFICRDDRGWTLILNQLKHDPFSVPNHAKAAITLANEVPVESPVYRHLVPRLLEALKGLGMASQWHPKGIAIPEPLPEPEPNQTGTNIVAPKALTEPDGFSEFWDVYPLRKNRAKAVKAFVAALRKVDAGTLVRAAECYAAQERRKGTEARYLAHAATWLNQEQWTDEPEPLTGREAGLAVLDKIIESGEMH